jgi:predicted lipid-binding transport protein (Tim44 family)
MKTLVVTLMIALLAFAGIPDAFAKAGSGGSFGSRGSRTADRPMQRSVTPPPAQVAPSPSQQPMYNPGAVRQPAAPMAAPMAQPSFFQRNPMMSGILGGLVGAGIGSMLFGHSPALAAASSAAPGASMFGTLLQLALLGGGAYLLYRLFRRRQEATATEAPYQRSTYQDGEQQIEMQPAGQAPRVEKEFDAAVSDQEAFSDILLGVQKAWSNGDVAKLRSLATPEIVSWLSDDLSRNASLGVVNKVENVTLVKGDVIESWREGVRDYVTAALTFSAIDTTVKLDTGELVEGDPKVPAETTEAWTFVRIEGGRWLLSAVERE